MVWSYEIGEVELRKGLDKFAPNVQGFAPGQSENTNYRTLGSVAANFFQTPHCRRGLAQNPLLAACGISYWETSRIFQFV